MAYDVSKVVNVARKLQEAGQSVEEIRARLRSAGIDDATINQALQEAAVPQPAFTAAPLAQPQPAEQSKMASLIARRAEPSLQASQMAQALPQAAPMQEILPVEQVQARALAGQGAAVIGSLADSIKMSAESHGQRLDSLKEALESHKFSTEELQKELKALRQDTTTLLEVDAKTIGQRLSGLERDLKEVKASTSALEDLMRKVLDSQRELVKQYKK